MLASVFKHFVAIIFEVIGALDSIHEIALPGHVPVAALKWSLTLTFHAKTKGTTAITRAACGRLAGAQGR